MPRSSHLSWALGAALAAHAGVFAWAYLHRPAAPATPPLAAAELSVEVEPTEVAPAPETAEPAAVPTELAPVARVERAPSGAILHAVGGAVGGAQAPASSSSEPPASDGSWTFSPTTTGSPAPAGPLGGAALGEATRAGIAATVAEESRKDEERRQRLPVFTPHDVALGLAPGGVLVSLSRELVRRSRVPLVSHAVLQFDTDGAGLVASFRVLDASDGRAEWGEVAAQIAADARARPLTVPSGARGVAVTVDVSSKMKTVNGADANQSAIDKALGALNDPTGAVAAGPPVRVIASHIVDVRAF
ncbi:MAG: hypothetical protein ABSE49_06090 [Polyangiaceae bacterium]